MSRAGGHSDYYSGYEHGGNRGMASAEYGWHTGSARGGSADPTTPLKQFAAQYCVSYASVYALVTRGQIGGLQLAHWRRNVSGASSSAEFGDFVISPKGGGTSLEKFPPPFTQTREMDKALDRMLSCITRFFGPEHPEVVYFETLIRHFKNAVCVGADAI